MKSVRWPMVLLGALALVFGIMTLDGYPIGASDDALYLVLAKSLATGEGYRSLNLPGAPPNTHFPPGYPAVLSLLWRISPSFPGNVVYFKAFNILCFVAIAIGTARFVERLRIGRGWSMAAGVLAAASVPLLILVALLLSEPLFLALLVFLLPALEDFARGTDDERPRIGRALLLGAAIGACTLVRSHGIVLVPAMALVLGAQRRWRHLILVCGAAMLCILPWQLWCARHGNTLPAPLLGGYDSYTSWWIRGLREMGWSMVPHTLARTIPEAGEMFAVLFSPLRGAVAHAVTIVALIVVALAGIVGSWRRLPITLLFLAGYLAIVVIWPFQPGRFIWGLWPLLLVVLLLGVHEVLTRPSAWRPPLRVPVLACAAWIAVGYALYETRAVKGRWWSTIPRNAAPHIAFAVEWAKGRTAPHDVVATEDEGAVYLYAGRSTLPVRALTARQYLYPEAPASENAQEGLIPLLAAYPVRAVIVYTRAGQDVARYLAERPQPILAPQGVFPGGAAFTVLPR
jgi:hypothetical protein